MEIDDQSSRLRHLDRSRRIPFKHMDSSKLERPGTRQHDELDRSPSCCGDEVQVPRQSRQVLIEPAWRSSGTKADHKRRLSLNRNGQGVRQLIAGYGSLFTRRQILDGRRAGVGFVLTNQHRERDAPSISVLQLISETLATE